MTALITVRLAGSVVRSCCASCHNATSPPSECDCICAGGCHGKGLEQAIVVSRVMYREWLERAQARGLEFDEVELGEPVIQDPLFILEYPCPRSS